MNPHACWIRPCLRIDPCVNVSPMSPKLFRTYPRKEEDQGIDLAPLFLWLWDIFVNMVKNLPAVYYGVIICTSSRVEYTVFGIIGSKFGLYIVNNGDWKGISTFRYLFEIQSQMQINITLVVEFQRWWVLKNKIFSYKWSDLKDFFWLFEMKEHGARSLRSSKKWVSMLLHFKKSNEILETWSPLCKNLAF